MNDVLRSAANTTRRREAVGIEVVEEHWDTGQDNSVYHPLIEFVNL